LAGFYPYDRYKGYVAVDYSVKYLSGASWCT